MANITDTQLASTTTPQGASLVGYRANAVGAVGRTELAKWQESHVVTPEDFGAVADGLLADGTVNATVNPDGSITGNGTDNTAALQAMFAALRPGMRVQLNGVYQFKDTLTAPAKIAKTGGGFNPLTGITIRGEDAYSSGFLYTGSDATKDLIKIGNGADSTYFPMGWTFQDFIIDSLKKMTAGAALHVIRGTFCKYDRVIMRGQYANINADKSGANVDFKLNHGYFLEGYFYSSIVRQDTHVGGTGVLVMGSTDGFGTELFIDGGHKIGGCNIGVHLAGGAGAVLIDNIDIIGSVVNNLLMDDALLPGHANNVWCGNRVSFDSIQDTPAAGDCILINDPNDYAQANFEGTWSATTSRGHSAIRIQRCGSNNFGYVKMVGCNFSNTDGSLIRIDTPVPQILIADCMLQVSNRYAIEKTYDDGGYRNVKVKDCLIKGCALGETTGNMEGVLSYWTPYVAGDNGSLPSQPSFTNPNYSRFIEVGKIGTYRMIYFEFLCTLPSSLGSASGTATFTLPYAADPLTKGYCVQGYANTSLGPLNGIIFGNQLRVLTGTGGATLKANEQIQVSGWYMALQTNQPN